jgi:hypothetical protein
LIFILTLTFLIYLVEMSNQNDSSGNGLESSQNLSSNNTSGINCTTRTTLIIEGGPTGTSALSQLQFQLKPENNATSKILDIR